MEQENTNLDQAKELKDKGNTEFKNGNFLQAIDYYSQAVELHQDHIYYGNRAICYLRTEKYESCIKDCDSAIALDPTWHKAYNRKGSALLKVGKIEEAILCFKKVVELGKNLEQAKKDLEESQLVQNYFKDLKLAEEKEDFEAVLRKIEMILRQCPAFESLIFTKMETLAKMNKLDDGIRLIKAYNSKYSSNPNFLYAAGLIYLYRGSNDHAIRMWREANNFDPDNTKYRNAVKNQKKAEKLKTQATTLFKEQKLDEAYEIYQQATLIDPYNVPFNSVVFSNMGTCLSKQSKYKEAIREFNKAIKINPEYAKAYQKRGNCQRELKK